MNTGRPKREDGGRETAKAAEESFPAKPLMEKGRLEKARLWEGRGGGGVVRPPSYASLERGRDILEGNGRGVSNNRESSPGKAIAVWEM